MDENMNTNATPAQPVETPVQPVSTEPVEAPVAEPEIKVAPAAPAAPVTPVQPVQVAPVAPVANAAQPAATGVQYASPWIRLLARIIDGFLVSFVGGFIGASTVTLENGQYNANMGLPGIGLFILYLVLMHGLLGQTLGKKIFKIKVIREDNSELLGIGKAILRDGVGWIIGGFTLGIAYLWCLWDKKHQTLYDKMAGSIVIKE